MNHLTITILPPFRYGLAGYICGTNHIRSVTGRQDFFVLLPSFGIFMLDLSNKE